MVILSEGFGSISAPDKKACKCAFGSTSFPWRILLGSLKTNN